MSLRRPTWPPSSSSRSSSWYAPRVRVRVRVRVRLRVRVRVRVRVSLRGGHEVAGVGHRHAPRQVVLAVEGAQLLPWVGVRARARVRVRGS